MSLLDVLFPEAQPSGANPRKNRTSLRRVPAGGWGMFSIKLGWTDSYLGLVAPNMMSAMGILIFRQTFMAIPDGLMEAARMEGCGEFQILTRIFWPLSKPAMATVGIVTFMGSWNEVLWPMLVVRERTMMTMPQLITLFSVGGQAGGEIGAELAASMILVIPIVSAYAFFQRYFIEGIAATGLKG